MKRLNSAVALDETEPTFIARFRTAELFKAVVLDNRKWTLDNKSLFFIKSVPGLEYWYSRRHVNRNADVLGQIKFKYKQTIMPEGSSNENLYLV